MRKLTQAERAIMNEAIRPFWIERDGLLPKEQRAFERGFIAGLDHAAGQGDHQRLEIAKQVEELQAERDEARAMVDRLRAALERWAEYSGALFDTADYERRNIEQSLILLQLIEDSRQALEGER